MSERENRVLTTLDPSEYHGMDRMSSSGIKQLLRSPAHFRAWKLEPKVATPQMMFGTLVHLLALEPHRVADGVAVVPDDAPDRRSKAGKEWWDAFGVRNADRLIVTADQWGRATAADRMLRSTPAWRGLMKPDGHIETSLLWTRSGVLCKARPDYIAPDHSYIVDVKTAADASRDAFQRALWNLRYDIQARFYFDGVEAATSYYPHSFAWAVVESEPPHCVAWYRMGASELDLALADIENGIEVYKVCRDTDHWPGYPADVQELRLPAWARKSTITEKKEF
jgi:exodeoxyribonuclease VIII